VYSETNIRLFLEFCKRFFEMPFVLQCPRQSPGPRRQFPAGVLTDHDAYRIERGVAQGTSRSISCVIIPYVDVSRQERQNAIGEGLRMNRLYESEEPAESNSVSTRCVVPVPEIRRLRKRAATHIEHFTKGKLPSFVQLRSFVAAELPLHDMLEEGISPRPDWYSNVPSGFRTMRRSSASRARVNVITFQGRFPAFITNPNSVLIPRTTLRGSGSLCAASMYEMLRP
jgi:hypothetical protein